MTPGTIGTVGRLVELFAPVLIAPHGDSYHRPREGQTRPACGVPLRAEFARYWVAVDQPFAELLDREACGRCWPHGRPNLGHPDQPPLFDVEDGQ